MSEKSGAEMAAEMEAEMAESSASIKDILKTADKEEGVDLDLESDDKDGGDEAFEGDGVREAQDAKDAAAEAAKAAADKTAADATAKAAGDEAVKKAAEDAAAKAAAAKVEEGASGIEGPGGKPIPYAVLKGERQRAHDLEESNRALKAELDQLKAGGKPGDGKTTTTDDAPSSLNEDEFDPTLVKVVRSLEARLAKSETELQKIRDTEAQAERDREQTVADTIAAEIEANPSLKAWKEAGGDEWNQAVAFDKVLRDSPAWAKKTYAERFEKVASMTADALGLPPPTPRTAPATTTAAPSKEPAAKTSAGKTQAKPAQVASISDLSGGGDPSLDAHDELENSTAAQIAVRMSNMNRADLAKFVRETG